MTSYHGGKQRIGKKLANIIVEESVLIAENEGLKINGYCEPFCGMLGVYQHIPNLYEGLKNLNYVAGDTNNSVVMMWKAAQKGWKPPTKVSEKKFNSLKYDYKTDSALKGYIGHQYSFGGQYFEGYAPKYGKNPDSTRASHNVQKIATNLKSVTFYNKSYTYFSTLKGYVIYCDPPYDQTDSRFFKKNKKKSFNSEDFWNWCRKMSKENLVFVSGYKAPNDFEKIFSSTHKLTGINTTNKKRIEKLFLI
jgi:site-specific DNA-adenine methylase